MVEDVLVFQIAAIIRHYLAVAFRNLIQNYCSVVPGILYPEAVSSCTAAPKSHCAAGDWRESEQHSELLSNAPILPAGYGIEHAQCVPPSEFSEPSFITESYQTLHPISSEELLSLKYENDYPSVILRDPVQTDSLQTDYFTIKQEVVTPDNMCMGRASRGKVGYFSWFTWGSCCLPIST